jgi:hypothetical protein
MTILFFLLLILLVLPLWSWMVVRIWKPSPVMARVSFILFVPAYFWGYHLWQRKESALRLIVLANLAAFIFLLLVGYKAFESEVVTVFFGREYAQEKFGNKSQGKTVAEWARWCKENNDATYDPVLGTCVENNKEEALARSESNDIFGRLTGFLSKNGIKSEIDQSVSVAVLQPKIVTAEIAQVTAFYFLPLSMSQPIVSVLLCVSEAACEKYEEDAKEGGALHFVRNANLLLILPPGPIEDARIETLKDAFAKFKTV